MDPFIQALAQYGAPAILAGVLVWQIPRQLDRLGERIERNTRAVMALVAILARAHGIDADEVHRLVGDGRR